MYQPPEQLPEQPSATPPRVLSIAGSDTSGGAGIQADLKTISACGAYALTAITAITAQDPNGVQAVQPVTAEQLRQQIDCALRYAPAAIKLGMPAGLSALIVGMQPILTAFAAPLIGERVRPRQWLGLLLGLCGVALVVQHRIGLSGLSAEALAYSVMALLSITIGTLYQRRFCPRFDLRTGTVVQFGATVALLLPLAVWREGFDLSLSQVQWSGQFVAALLWSVCALSIGAIFLLFKLISRNDATQVTSLLYLTPPTTAVMAWLLFGEALGAAGLLGMAVAVAGVAFVVKK